MYYLYVLKSLKDNKLYIGSSNDWQIRLYQHNNGHTKSTRFRRPFVLIYKETYKTKSEAMKREWYFKNTGEGNKLMRRLIERQ